MKSFLQSQEWADFQKSLGRKVWQINNILVIKYNLPLGKSYLYSPRCGGDFLSALEKIKEIGKKENSIFFKIEPIENINLKNFKKSHDLQPKKTLVLDIKKSEQELLNKMHKKARYNINLALKKGLKIQSSRPKAEDPRRKTSGPKSKVQNFEKFWEMLQDTAKRGRFKIHPEEHYEKMLKISGMELFVAEYQNKIIAANIVLFYGKRAIYLHGASDYEYRNLMAPYLLQWHQILEAKKQGRNEYDFWGIDEKKWPGVTRFKKGFSGKEIFYPGAYDLVFQPLWYRIYKIARRIL